MSYLHKNTRNNGKLKFSVDETFRDYIESVGGVFGNPNPIEFNEEFPFQSHWVNSTREALEHVISNVVDQVLGRKHTKRDLDSFSLVHITGLNEGIEIRYNGHTLGIITHGFKDGLYTVEFNPVDSMFLNGSEVDKIGKLEDVIKIDRLPPKRDWEDITKKYAERMGVLWGKGSAFYVSPNSDVAVITIMHPSGKNYQFKFDCMNCDDILHARIKHACTLIRDSILDNANT